MQRCRANSSLCDLRGGGSVRSACPSRLVCTPASSAGLIPVLRDSGAQTSSQNLVVRFGQSITPENKTRTDVIPDDRPYAGSLLHGFGVESLHPPQAASYEMLDVRELTWA